MPAQYEGIVWLLVEYKGNNKYGKEKVPEPKSHDCHVIMTQLLSVGLRGLLPENVRLAIVKLCAFLNAISHKVIGPEIIPRLEMIWGNVLSALSWCPTILLQHHDAHPSS